MGKIYSFVAYLIASFGFVGFIPFASGTFGSVASFFVIIPAMKHFGLVGVLGVCVISFIVGVLATRRVLKNTAQINNFDPSFVVIDEVCGQAITVLPLCLGIWHKGFWLGIFVAFALFRFFDITKPLIIGYIDRKTRGAFGVMMDDVMAGIFGYVVFYALCLLLR